MSFFGVAFGISKPCKADLAPASPRLGEKVWGNNYIPNVVFSFLELGEDSENVSRVCKRWKKHANDQYQRRERLNLNWLFVTNGRESRCHKMTADVLEKCTNLKAVTVPDSQTGRYRPSWYFPIFQSLPAKLEELDFSPAYPYELHHLAAPADGPQLQVTPQLRRLRVSGGLSNRDIDLIAEKLPGLQELRVNGLLDLEYLLRKCGLLKQLSSLFLCSCIEQDTFIRRSTDETLATVPECASLRRVQVTMYSAKADDQFVKFLIRKMPSLECLHFHNCRIQSEQPFLNSLLTSEDVRNLRYFSAELNAPRLEKARLRLKDKS